MGFKDMIRNILDIPEQDYYDDVDEDVMAEYGASERVSTAATARQRVSHSPIIKKQNSDNNIVNIHTTAQLQVVLVKPEIFSDASSIADHLNNKHTVVLNLESAPQEIGRRLVDFLSGVAYANDGKIKKVSNSIYIITPYNVDVMGDLIDELESNGICFE